MNDLFGDATPLRAQALRGNLPGAVRAGVAQAFSSHQTLAAQVLKQDPQAMGAPIEMVYEFLHEGRKIDLSE